MKSSRLRIPIALTCVIAAVIPALAAVPGPVYELRTYTATPGNRDAVVARFRNDTVRIFEKHGMRNIGYWLPMDEKDGGADKLVYLLEHSSRDAAKAAWKSFSADPEWQAVRQRTEAKGKIVAKAESVFLEPTDYSPAVRVGAGPAAPRVFELRTYTAAEGKLADLDARFRNHTLKLFAKHGMTNIAYFHPSDADKGAANTLVYVLAHASREAAVASWQAFRDDPDWVKARTASEKSGKLTTKVQSVFLTPTDFSPLK